MFSDQKENIDIDSLKETLEKLAPAPADSNLVATRLVEQAQVFMRMTPEDSNKLIELIRVAFDERKGLIEDIRLGRVLGSALATL